MLQPARRSAVFAQRAIFPDSLLEYGATDRRRRVDGYDDLVHAAMFAGDDDGYCAAVVYGRASETAVTDIPQRRLFRS